MISNTAKDKFKRIVEAAREGNLVLRECKSKIGEDLVLTLIIVDQERQTLEPVALMTEDHLTNVLEPPIWETQTSKSSVH